MIQQALNSMIAIMMAKFMLNDVPHALGITAPIIPTQDREHVASTHWNEILKYCHTIDDLKRIASGQGTIKLYHGCPAEYARIMIREDPRVPYKVEDTARYVANVYGIPWMAFYRWAYRRHEVREKLSTSTAPVAARWAWSFPLGEVLTDLNAHARMYVAFKAKSVREGISLDDAYDKLYNEAVEIAKATGQRCTNESAPNILGLPDKLALRSGSGALVEIVVDAKVEAVSYIGSHDAGVYLKEIESGELSVEDALLHWNHDYRDFRINPDDIISMRIVVKNLRPWEQDMIEDMVKEKRLNPYCGVPSATMYHVTHKDNLDSILEKGLLASETSSGMLFFFPTLEYARESGLTDMAILAVMLTGEEIDKCEIGEIFPDLYEERFGGQPPADTSLRSYLEHPVPYGVPEISCTIVRIPPDRIRYVEIISGRVGAS